MCVPFAAGLPGRRRRWRWITITGVVPGRCREGVVFVRCAIGCSVICGMTRRSSSASCSKRILFYLADPPGGRLLRDVLD